MLVGWLGSMGYAAWQSFVESPDIYSTHAALMVVSGTTAQAEAAWLQSAEVLTPVIDKLGLDRRWAKRLYKTKLEALPAKESLSYLRKTLKIATVSWDGEKMHFTDPSDNVIAGEWLKPPKGTKAEYVFIKVKSDVGSEAAEIANTLADGEVKWGAMATPVREVRIVARAVVPKRPYLPDHARDIRWAELEAVPIAVALGLVVETIALYFSQEFGRFADAPARERPSELY